MCFIIYKREDSFHHDLLQKQLKIHFIMAGIHFYRGIQFRYRLDSFCTIARNHVDGHSICYERIHFIIALNPSRKLFL